MPGFQHNVLCDTHQRCTHWAHERGSVGNVFTNGLIIILVFHLPVVIYLVLRRFLVEESVPHRHRRFFCFLLTGLLLFFAGHYTSTCTSALRSQYHDNYSYDSSVKNFGLLSALVQQWERGIMGSEESTSAYGGKPAEISQYAMSCEPTMKNEYTGMFDGKNLILITAEALPLPSFSALSQTLIPSATITPPSSGAAAWKVRTPM